MIKKLRDILMIAVCTVILVGIVATGVIVFSMKDSVIQYGSQAVESILNIPSALDGITTGIQSGSDSGLNDRMSQVTIMVDYNNESEVVPLDSTTITLDPIKLTTEFTNTLTFTMPEGMVLTIDDQSITSENPVWNLDLDEISLNNVFEGVLTYDGCVRKVILNTWPQNLPKIQFTGSTTNTYGHFYTDIYTDHPYIVKFDGTGHVVFYQAGQSEMHDFKQTIGDDGNTYYTYYRNFRFVLLDDHYNEIKEIGLQPSEKLGSIEDLDCHDILLYNPDHYYVFGYVPKNVGVLNTDDTNNLVSSAFIQEVDHGNVVFEWDSTDYPQFLESTKDLASNGGNFSINNGGSNDVNDYMHINSIFIDPRDGNIIASFRHQSAILKISRETGEVLWTLGGTHDDFGITDEQTFFYQHTASILDDGSLLLFNNGNDKQVSNVMRFVLDEQNKTIVEFTKYQPDGHFSMACGSSWLIDENHILVGWRVHLQGKVLASIINTETGEIENEFITPDGTTYSYRFHYSSN